MSRNLLLRRGIRFQGYAKAREDGIDVPCCLRGIVGVDCVDGFMCNLNVVEIQCARVYICGVRLIACVVSWSSHGLE
jgi:hypothetical protein